MCSITVRTAYSPLPCFSGYVPVSHASSVLMIAGSRSETTARSSDVRVSTITEQPLVDGLGVVRFSTNPRGSSQHVIYLLCGVAQP